MFLFSFVHLAKLAPAGLRLEPRAGRHQLEQLQFFAHVFVGLTGFDRRPGLVQT